MLRTDTPLLKLARPNSGKVLTRHGIKLVTEVFLGTFKAKLFTLLYNIQVFSFYYTENGPAA